MHQSEQFEQLVRRVGYSVGLEDLVSRVEILTDVYFNERDMNLALWKNIVQERYHRRTSDDFQETTWIGARKSKTKLGAEDHFANFYSQLNLLTKVQNQVMPLYGLDVLSILKGSLTDIQTFRRALRTILTLFVIETDGDIFLNCIVGDFEKDTTADAISAMFNYKHEAYKRAFQSQQARSKLESVFTVQSAKQPQSVQNGPYSVSAAVPTTVPPEYLDKVLPTRKGWYEQLEIDRTGRASTLSFLKKQGILVNDRFCAFFPYAETHRKFFIPEGILGVNEISHLDFVRDAMRFFSGVHNLPVRVSREHAIALLREIAEAYKNTSSARGVLRHQIPLYILFPCFYLILMLRDHLYMDLEVFLTEETRRADERILDVTNLKGSEGALSIKS